MLLIMGLATQMIAWPPPFLDGLAASGFRVIRFDNRDIGLSTKSESVPQRKDVLRSMASSRLAKSEYSLQDMAADAAGGCSTTCRSPQHTSSACRWAA